jgi:hypothetical protein
MPQEWPPDVLLAINDSARGTEDLHQRNHTQGDENRPDYLIPLEYLSSEISPGEPLFTEILTGGKKWIVTLLHIF